MMERQQGFNAAQSHLGLPADFDVFKQKDGIKRIIPSCIPGDLGDLGVLAVRS
jgi:hypothetical protein